MPRHNNTRKENLSVQSHHGREQRYRPLEAFYDAVFAAMGGKPATEDAKGRLIYAHRGGRFMVSKPIDGDPRVTPMAARSASSWSRPPRSRPGTRPARRTAASRSKTRRASGKGAAGPIFLAYLRDPDGNKLCGLHRMASK